MKMALAIGSVVTLFLYCALVVVAVMTPLNPYGNGKWIPPPEDFSLRMTEIDCLLRGVNPYDVWHGDVVLKPYVPNHGAPRRAVEGKDGFTEYINAYAPWEYIMMMPFVFLPRAISWVFYFLMMMAGLGVLFWASRSFGMAFAGVGREAGMIVGSAPIVLAALPMYQNFHAGNLAVPVLVAAALMAICLNRGHDLLAGVCWAFAMMKPQLGLAFAIPLLLRRKFLTCFVAASICLALSFAASFICGSSPVDMVFQSSAASVHAFNGCGTFPYFLCRCIPGDTSIVAGVLVGAVLCVFLTVCLMRSGVREWTVLLMPAAVVGSAWTYAQCYSFTMNWFFFAVLVAALAKRPRSKFLWCMAVLSILLMTRIYNFAHTLSALAFGLPPGSSLHYHVDSLLSTASLAVLTVFCVWLSRRNVQGGKM